jgi:hypothetical protein
VRWLRTADCYLAFQRFVRFGLAPALFAIFTVVGSLALLSHVAFYFEDAAGFTCTPTAKAKPLPVGHTSEQLVFTPDRLCWGSGLQLTAGNRYVISIEEAGTWQDGDYTTHLGGYEVTSLPGLLLRAQMFVLTPLRRVLLRPWFRVIARLGEAGTDEYFLDPDRNQTLNAATRLDVPIRPNRSGEFYLYVVRSGVSVAHGLLVPEQQGQRQGHGHAARQLARPVGGNMATLTRKSPVGAHKPFANYSRACQSELPAGGRGNRSRLIERRMTASCRCY